MNETYNECRQRLMDICKWAFERHPGVGYKEVAHKIETFYKEKDIMDNATPILPHNPTEKEKTELAKKSLIGKYYSPYKLIYDRKRKTIVGMDIHDFINLN